MAHLIRFFRLGTQTLRDNLGTFLYQKCNLSSLQECPTNEYCRGVKGYSQSLATSMKGASCSKFRNDISKAHVRSFYMGPVLYKKNKMTKKNIPEINADDENFIEDEDLNDPQFESLRSQSRLQGLGGVGSSRVGVMVVQPWIKWGHQKKTNTTGQLMLEEAVALVSTLPDISVEAQEVVSLLSLGRKAVFGSGTLEKLVTQARTSKNINCVFISLDIMKKGQIETLEATFGMRVVDRYSVVLSIFHQHARTREAKLQVALAELPYIRKRVSYEQDRMMLAEREKRLKAGLTKLAGIRAQVRESRAKSSLPTVAVVGYTNSGKTSLIRAITQDSRAEGRDQLFATLDVTAHGGRLPCGVEVAFIDTIGFIQDIPTDLVASFKATLEDAICSDVVVHVRDASHPDYDLQGATVSRTLATLPLPLATPILIAANKVDLGIVRPPEQLEDAHLVSAITGEGIEELLEAIEREVLRVTGREMWKFTLSTGSDQIQWLRRATGLVQEEMDQADPQITRVFAVLTEQELAAFKRNFGGHPK